MKKKPERLVLARLLQKLAPQIGASVALEPNWKIAGQITYKNGTRRYFRYNALDLNPVGSADISKDKDYAAYFMKSMGYPTVLGRAFFSDAWCTAIGSQDNIDAAYRYAQKIGLPVIVKPNSGSQGTGVALVHTKKDFFRALRSIFKNDKVALVQTPVAGKDYRVVVLDNRVISAYERIPLNVIGDGASNVRQLLLQKSKAFVASSRDTRIKMDDPRMKEKLARQGLTFQSKLRKGQVVYLLDNANLSSGGDSVDVTDSVHPEFKKIAVQLTKGMGLRLCGVDLMIDGTITEQPEKYWILEINAAPGLDHYVKTGKAQEKIVEELYLEVLKSMEK